MEKNKKNNHLIEFSPKENYFEKVRNKGTARWILAHILSKSNKFYIFVVLFTTIIAATLSSLTMVVVGIAINGVLFKISS